MSNSTAMELRVAASLVLLVSLSGLAAPVDQASQVTSIVSRARAWLGGVEPLANVVALEVVRENGTTRILLPDKYQIETRTDHGPMVVSFDGRQFWTRMPAGLPPVADAVPSPEIQVRGKRNAAEQALLYLLRTVSTYPLKAALAEAAACAGISSACIEWMPASGSGIRIAFGSDDGRPLAMIQPMSQPEGLRVTVVSDYRVFDGLRLPTTISEERLDRRGATRRVVSTWHKVAFRVNPPLKASDFTKVK